MWFLNQWRLPLLFVISGMGTFYSLNKRTGGQYLRERFIRLYIPLTVGMLFIVPPQVYVERLYFGQFTGSYLQFWPAEAFIGSYPEGNISWHHLWFLPYLLIYSVVLSPLFLYIRRHPDNNLSTLLRRCLQKPLGWYVFAALLYLPEAFLEPYFPVTHALVGDWFNLTSSMLLFFFGFLLISVSDVFWPKVVQYRRIFLFTGIASFALLIAITHLFEDSWCRHYIEAAIKVVNLWTWVLAMFGLAAKHLNKNSRVLYYANEAVYPFYILHQSVMMVIAFYIVDLNWGLACKFTLLLIGTFGISWILYEFGIRRYTWVRPLFGLKLRKKI